MAGNDNKGVTKHNVFVTNGTDDPMSPKNYGFWSVQWSIQGLTELTKIILEIPGNNKHPRLQHRIVKDPKILHYHLVAYETAAYYLYCAAFLKLPHSVLDEILSGILAGIETLQTKEIPISKQNAQALYQSVQKYSQAIYAELREAPQDPEDIRLDSDLSGGVRKIVEG